MKSPLWIDFANSLARDPLGHGPPNERLDNPKWVAEFLARCEISRNSLPRKLEGAATKRLQGLRDLLIGMAELLASGKPIPPASLKALNSYLALGPVHSELAQREDATTPGFHLRLRTEAKGVDALLFVIAASFAEFMSEADPTRIRLCENPDCRWVLYDTTRSRTKRWCADSCGNLIKVRKFRAKQAEASDS